MSPLHTFWCMNVHPFSSYTTPSSASTPSSSVSDLVQKMIRVPQSRFFMVVWLGGISRRDRDQRSFAFGVDEPWPKR